MKLRNKKTGQVKKMCKNNICLDFGDCIKVYYFLAELNEEWEDYMPKEPLIKDEKVRKAVRAWAETVGDYPLCFYEDTDYVGRGMLKIYKKSGYPAVFDLGHPFYDLELDMQYSIDELCGEDEE